MFNINGKQIILVIGAIVSVLVVSTAQLTELLGPGLAKTIVTIAGLINMTLQSVGIALNTQMAQVHDVQAMPGVQNILVNAKASPTLAAMAADPSESKVVPTPEDAQAVALTARKKNA